jgi:hypothetical protein
MEQRQVGMAAEDRVNKGDDFYFLRNQAETLYDPSDTGFRYALVNIGRRCYPGSASNFTSPKSRNR